MMKHACFTAGFLGGAASTAYVAGQPDWWFWAILVVPVAFWAAWIEAKEEYERKRSGHGRA